MQSAIRFQVYLSIITQTGISQFLVKSKTQFASVNARASIKQSHVFLIMLFAHQARTHLPTITRLFPFCNTAFQTQSTEEKCPHSTLITISLSHGFLIFRTDGQLSQELPWLLSSFQLFMHAYSDVWQAAYSTPLWQLLKSCLLESEYCSSLRPPK